MNVDKNGFSMRDPITDDECILLCLKNCEQLCGVDKKQVMRLIKEWTLKKSLN